MDCNRAVVGVISDDHRRQPLISIRRVAICLVAVVGALGLVIGLRQAMPRPVPRDEMIFQEEVIYG